MRDRGCMGLFFAVVVMASVAAADEVGQSDRAGIYSEPNRLYTSEITSECTGYGSARPSWAPAPWWAIRKGTVSEACQALWNAGDFFFSLREWWHKARCPHSNHCIERHRWSSWAERNDAKPIF